MDAVDEPPMARDFFKSTPRGASPPYRWARRSRSRTSASRKEQAARCPQGMEKELSPLPRRYGAPAPLRSKSLVVDAAARPSAVTLASSSLKCTPVRKAGLTGDGADSPTGPLDFPASPSSSLGSFKDTASPVPKLGPIRSMRPPSPNRGPPRQGSSLSLASPDLTRRSAGKIRSGAQTSSPLAVQNQVDVPTRSTDPGPAARTRECVNVAKECGPSKKVEYAVGTRQSGVKAAARHTTPFRRGLDAIKGRLFSESRRSSEAAAAEEIRKTQETLAAGHKVKPAASSGLKSMLVSRLTRLGRSSRSVAPPPLAIQEAPFVPCTESTQPAPGLLNPPRHLALHSPTVAEQMQTDIMQPRQGPSSDSSFELEDASSSQADKQGARLAQETESSIVRSAGGQGPLGDGSQETAGEKEARQVEEEEGESGWEGKAGGTRSWAHTPVAVERSVARMQSSIGDVAGKMNQLSDGESDSDEDSPILCSRSRLSFQEAPTPSPPRPSWAQRVPFTASPAASWDSQSSLEFANSHRPSVAHRFLSSESSSSEQGSPRYVERSRASPLGVTSTMTSATLAACDDNEGLAESASPASAAPPVLSPRLAAGPLPLWSSDEDEEEGEKETEDRSCRKRDMAAALHHLREFQAGGATPRRVTAPLQRSLTDPSVAVIARRTASPMRTLWRQASAAVGAEGSTSSPARMSLAAAGRALSSRSLSRSRDRSPCPAGLLASPRPLLAEPSPLRARPGAFDDTPRAGAPCVLEARRGHSSFMTSTSNPVGGAPGRFAKTPGRARPIAAAAAFFRSMTPGRQRAQVM